MRTIIKYIVIIQVVFCLNACEKIEVVSDVPDIVFQKFDLKAGKDTLGNDVYTGDLVFSFIDGDGGDLKNAVEGDTIYTIYTIPFIKEENGYINSDFDSSFYILIYDLYDMQQLEKSGQNKILKGEISLNKQLYFKPADTIRYEIYIIDIDSNISNHVFTDDIGL